MVKKRTNSEIYTLSALLADDDDVVDVNNINSSVSESGLSENQNINDTKDEMGHLRARSLVEEEATVSSPDNIPDFLDAIGDIKSPDGQPIYTVQTKGDTFRVFKDDENGGQVEVLNGNTKTCKMSSPLDQNVLNAYINAHKGKRIIVDNCKSKSAAIQLIDACIKAEDVTIEFPPGMLKNLGFDAYDFAKHPLPVNKTTKPDVEFMTKSSMKRD